MNVAAVFAPKKVYGCSGFGAFNSVLKLKFAATTRARASIGVQCHAAYGKAAVVSPSYGLTPKFW
jgi:hypothetical protein